MGKAGTASRNKNVSGAIRTAVKESWRHSSSFFVLLAMSLLFAAALYAADYSLNIAHFRKHGAARLNDLTITPGLVRSTSKSSICNGGSTKQYRKTTEAMKKQVYAEYGVDKKKLLAGTMASAEDKKHPLYEIDHLISLELGGADDVRNLWPQPYYEHPGAHEKDAVENWLHRQVCSGDMEPADAQKQISEDWYAVYLRMPK